LDEATRAHDVRFWSDVRATNPGFARELIEELNFADAIVQCVGSKGLGFYQGLNEVDATINAMRARSDRRLLVILLDGAEAPSAFARFDEFAARRTVLSLNSPVDATAVLRAALPSAAPRSDQQETNYAREVLNKTQLGQHPKWLTIIVGPYAAAESLSSPSATPQHAIAHVLGELGVPGTVPWLHVLGSVVRATKGDDDDTVSAIERALTGTHGGPSQLDTYLRILAWNWSRRQTPSRLVIISCTPDLRLDTALRTANVPVPHLRLVHCPARAGRLLAERISVNNSGDVVRTELKKPTDKLNQDDRVVLIKPFGCFEEQSSPLVTAEQWSQHAAGTPMPLPTGMAAEMVKSVVLTLGAGAFSPSLQVLFQSLLRDALSNPNKNRNRYLVHDAQPQVGDELHRLERHLVNRTDRHGENYEKWLYDFYGLDVLRMRAVTLLADLDRQLVQLVA